MSNLFNCKALDHAITFLPTGKVSPCCLIKNYSKDIETVADSNRFSDLKIEGIPVNCSSCVNAGSYSYKHTFDSYTSGTQMIDFRNSNLCNLKCRTCGPDYSSKWADELGIAIPIRKINVDAYVNQILTDNVSKIYFAGGEPMLNQDHWQLLDTLISRGLANKISLQYNTNLTVLGYKDKSAIDYWAHFAHVSVSASIDGTGTAFEYLRSGASWEVADVNLTRLVDSQNKNLSVSIAFTLSVLSVWFLKDVLVYAQGLGIEVRIMQLTDPHYFTLNVLPDDMVNTCVSVLEECILVSPLHKHVLLNAIGTAKKNDDTGSFTQMMSTVLLTDKIRNENLFDLLPFKNTAIQHILKNQ